ncbi:MAG: antitoxin [Actinomycetota bacterium]
MLTHRLQVLLDPAGYRRLADEARRRGVPIARLVRDALDATYGSGSPAQRRAADKILGAERMEVPDIEALRAELDEARASRA